MKKILASTLIVLSCLAARAQHTNPPVTSGLQLDLDPVVGFTANTWPALSTWADQSGTGNTLTTFSPVATANPSLTNVNGLSAVKFAGTSVMKSANTNGFGTTATVFVVSTSGTYGGGTNAPVSIQDTTRTLKNEFTIEANTVYHHSQASNWVGKTHQCLPLAPDGQVVVQTGAWNTGITSADLDMFVDGNKSTSGTSTLGAATAYTAVPRIITLGSRIQVNTLYHPFTGSIFRVLAYNRRLSDAEISQVSAYLVQLYGAVLSRCMSDTTCSDACFWKLQGNTVSGTNNVLGAINSSDLRIVTNAAERMRISAAGNVGIGLTTPQSPLDVYKTAQATALSTSYGANVVNGDIVAANGTACGIFANANGLNTASSANNYGGYFFATNSSNINAGCASVGGGGTSAYGGTFLALNGTSANYGIYSTYFGTQTASNCAGYFNGACYSSGNLNPSDENLKTNIKPVNNMLPLIEKLQVNSYQFKNDQLKGMNLPQGDQIGLLAKNLQSVFPGLVQQVTSPASETGKDLKFMAVNYTGLVPVLIQAVKELHAENAELKQQLNEICSSGCATLKGNSSQTDNKLFQNIPNPFSQQTAIGYSINTGTTASIEVNSLDGKMIKHLDIPTKGQGSVSFSAADLSVGTYTYTLFVDGSVIDTKLMIISGKQ